MSKDVTTCGLDDSVETAAQIMLDKGFSVLPVVDDDNNFAGIVTESDFVGKEVDVPHSVKSIKKLLGSTFNSREVGEIYSEAKQKPLKDIMTTGVRTISKDDDLSEVVELMIKKNLKRLPVVENKKIIGIVTRKDFLKTFLNTENKKED